MSTMAACPLVHVTDANAIFRRGLTASIEAGGFRTAGESEQLPPAEALADVDVLLFDVDDTSLTKVGLLRRGCDTRLVAIARRPREDLLYDGVAAGLSGFLLRSDLNPHVVVSCLHSVIDGYGAVPPELLSKLLVRLAHSEGHGAPARELQTRELDVLRLLADGGSTREIALDLSYSERTVKNIIRDVLLKMDCRTRAHAAALATRHGYI
jgi:DNA-binding NarL/FixJ family response regulator